MTARRAVLVLPVVAAFATAPAFAGSTCSFDAGVVIVDVTAGAVLDRTPEGAIRLDGVACGAATVTNTDLVKVTSPYSPPMTVTIDVANAFAPGLTAETDGDSEVEILWSGGGGLALSGGDGPDHLRWTGDGARLNDDDDVDLILAAGPPDVTLSGNGGDDVLDASVAIDDTVLDGGDGDDVLLGSGFSSLVHGGSGNDLIASSFGWDTVDGGDGDDVILEGEGYGFEHDVIEGGAGTDLLSYAGRGDPVVVGYDGPVDRPRQYVDRDDITGVENVTGGDGADVLHGDAGPNVIDGGPGNDEIHGGDGDDVVSGGDGADLLVEGDLPNGADVLSGGPGRDLGDYGRRFLPSTISLDDVADDGAPGEGDNVRGDVEDLWGGQLGDVLTGSAAVNHFWGFGGDDVFRLDDGVLDKAYGGVGVDVLYRDALDHGYEVELLLPP